MTDEEKRPSRPHAPYLTALWRKWWHLCPECNSDAPYKDVCPVCKSGQVHRSQWWDRYLYFRDNSNPDD